VVAKLNYTLLDPRDFLDGQHCPQNTPRYHNSISHIQELLYVLDRLLIFELSNDLYFVDQPTLFLQTLVLLRYYFLQIFDFLVPLVHRVNNVVDIVFKAPLDIFGEARVPNGVCVGYTSDYREGYLRVFIDSALILDLTLESVLRY